MNDNASNVFEISDMAHKAPGKSHRQGMTMMQLMDMFPTEDDARQWFESTLWPNGRVCGHCGSQRTCEASHKKMPYWCSDCRSYFSVKTGTPLQSSKIPLRKWAIAVYLCITNLKSVSSMKLRRDLGVTQKTAWFMLQRIREAWIDPHEDDFNGPVEVDEHAETGASVYTDDAKAHKGTFHKLSPKHLNRHVHEFAGKHSMRELDMLAQLAQMTATVAALVGRRLLYRKLTADNGISSAARS